MTPDARKTLHTRGEWISAGVLFALILIVYIVTLMSLFPAMPVISRAAETIPGYDLHYPPFRLDEYNYHTIARSVLSGEVYRDGALEFDFPIGFPVVAAPFVAVFGDRGGYLANLLILWAAAILFYVLARRYTSSTGASILTAILAFATLNWFYATSCYAEPLAQLLVLGSFGLATTHAGPDRRMFVFMGAAGVVLGLTLFVRPHYILLGAPFAWYLAGDDKSLKRLNFPPVLISFLGGAAIVVLLWMIRNGLVFGSPFSFEYSKMAGSFTGGESGYMQGNIFLGIHRLLFDVYHGLFTITPVFLLVPAGLRSMWCAGHRRVSIMLTVSAMLMILFVASGPYPFTEFGLGSRHLVPLLPLLVLPTACFLNRTLFRAGLVALVALYSFYHAGFGWFTGGEPGMGFYLGILNDNQARAVILARKGLLPTKPFESREKLMDAFSRALDDAHLYRFLETLTPASREMIRGNERAVLLELRRQEHPELFIESADPIQGIMLQNIMFR